MRETVCNYFTRTEMSLFSRLLSLLSSTKTSPPTMSSSTEPSQAQVPYTGFPASDLRQPKRLVTSHNEDGKGVFLPEDDGDHHRVILDGTAVCNIIYSTQGNPVNLNEDADVKRAKDNEV